MQPEFNFDQAGQVQDGYQTWVQQRQATLTATVRRLALPLGHPVEMWLLGGVRLRGQLQFEDPPLFIEDSHLKKARLCVDGVGFDPAEIESFVRLD
jgi:hypothetical protein